MTSTTTPVAGSSIIEVYLADGTYRSVRVDDQTSVQKIVEVVLTALELKPLSFNHFALRLNPHPGASLSSANDCHWLHPCLRMPELRRRYIDPAPAGVFMRFELRIRFLLSDMQEMYQTQMGAFFYLYDQLASDYVRHLAWKIDVPLAMQMAALMLRKRFPNATSETLDKKLDFSGLEREGGLVKYLPEALIINTKRKQLEKSILQAVHKVVCLTELECVFRFMKLLADLTPFDIEVFRASLGTGPLATVEVHVGYEVGVACRTEHSKAAVSLTSLQNIRSVFIQSLVDRDKQGSTMVKLNVTAANILTFTLPTMSMAESFAHLVDGYHQLLLGTPTNKGAADYSSAAGQRAWRWEGSSRAKEAVAICPSLPSTKAPVDALSRRLAAVKEEKEAFPEADYATPMSPELLLHIDRRLIRLEELLGDGQFGNVYKGLYASGDNKIPVAVKVCKAHNDVYDTSTANKFLVEEAYRMAQFQHPHIVKLVGLCEAPLVWIVMELAALGQLRVYLIRERGTIDVGVQVSFAHQLASALAYLHNQHFVHRDIAARNVLVANHHCVKLSDFGLSRFLGTEDDYTASKGKLPIKWLPPESINYRKFSSQSDVYMFGVCMWEILSWGVKPWQGVRNHEVVIRLERGELLQAPPGCPPALYTLLKSLWLLDPRLRPSMLEVKAYLADLLQQMKQVCYSQLSVPPHFHVLKKSVDEQTGYSQVNRLHTPKSSSAVQHTHQLADSSLWRALQEQRLQCDEDDRWLEEVEEKLLPPAALNCRRQGVQEEGEEEYTAVLPHTSSAGELEREGDGVHEAVLCLVTAITTLSSNYSSQMSTDEFLLIIQEIKQKADCLIQQSEVYIKELSELDNKQVALIRLLLYSDLKSLTKMVEKSQGVAGPYWSEVQKRELLKVTHMLAVNSKHFLDTMDTARINSGTAIFKQIDNNNNH